jgi:hypothetical protein
VYTELLLSNLINALTIWLTHKLQLHTIKRIDKQDGNVLYRKMEIFIVPNFRKSTPKTGTNSRGLCKHSRRGGCSRHHPAPSQTVLVLLAPPNLFAPPCSLHDHLHSVSSHHIIRTTSSYRAFFFSYPVEHSHPLHHCCPRMLFPHHHYTQS